MTLIIGMSKHEGVYMSTDYRVTDARTGRVLDDASIKFLTVHYPPDKTGPRALFGYTGLAALKDGTPMGRWIRETLRGQTEVVDVSMAHLRERLNRDVASMRYPLIVNVLVIEPERRLMGGLSNLFTDSQGTARVQDSFGYSMQALSGPFLFTNGSGASRVSAAQLDLLDRQLDVIPRKPFDHMNLLASVNRRVAATDQTVSPFCNVAFLNGDQRTEPASHAFVEHRETVPFAMPHLLFGIDISYITEQFHRQSEAFMRGDAPAPDFNPDPDAVNKELRRRP
jgi:hypothetical protein